MAKAKTEATNIKCKIPCNIIIASPYVRQVFQNLLKIIKNNLYYILSKFIQNCEIIYIVKGVVKLYKFCKNHEMLLNLENTKQGDFKGSNKEKSENQHFHLCSSQRSLSLMFISTLLLMKFLLSVQISIFGWIKPVTQYLLEYK